MERSRLLTEDRERRAYQLGDRRQRWTNPQLALFSSPYRLTVWWGANGIGKSEGIAELVRRALASELPWQRPGPKTVILCGNTWTQLGSTLEYLWRGVDRRWFESKIRFEGGGMKGQRLPVYDLVGGPGRGGQFRCGTFRANNLAGPRADVVITDEPLPEDVYNELWPRLLGRSGRMYQTFTPTIGTTEDLTYLWQLVDNPDLPWAGELQTELTLNAVTPRGGLVEIPWMISQEIAEFAEGLSAVEVDMRMGRTRTPRRDTAYFSAWGPHLLTEDSPPGGTPVGIGIDHGSKPGAQRASLVAVGGRGLYARVWVLAEYKGTGRTESEQDAAGILAMLDSQNMSLSDVDLWVGDRAHRGDRRGGRKSNERLKQSIAKALGHDTSRRGWGAHLPKPLLRMQVPRKYDRSVWEGCEILHRLMVGEHPRLSVSPVCVHLNEDLSLWQGSSTDPHKDGVDSFRYITVPMVEGKRR